ncbi:MAG: 16S rRNA (guanine(527)-N(7))-methyltransferase RsmG [Bacteroidia bacterium]|nr:16S rRNA (guanine(527)-N(7))-methyltransferase RsmG [Bacteroidia bacterium]MCO5253773.1 16S rRNA (guanine(527)-N(7))-methyltransferase RsmG [Bacteroidota bacterium]MCZ2130809.1 16S rRNA (guanine(527)-N(7))-methyltransferase RsmG [Bacteroidia bacterium]
MNPFEKYLNLSDEQESKLRSYAELLLEWNEKINLISRKDTEFVIERHILHSLGIGKLKIIKPGFEVLDVGTGGGLPGIPLAIVYPKTNFTLVDSIQKKIRATSNMVKRLELNNVTCVNARVETMQQKFEIITGRAVTRLSDFYQLTRHLMLKNGTYLLLKGGDLQEEIAEFEQKSRLKVKIHELHKSFPEPFFETKFVLEITNKV